MSKIWGVLTRKKVLNPVSLEETRLSRILGTFDLTALGVGSTLGVGVYVLAGKVAKDIAGPSVILSFLIAAVVSVFAGLCYAEFGARVPKAGSAYIYSYVCIGEFAAFVIGWNLILEYIIGSASVARGISLYLDTLLNNTLETTFKEVAPINLSFMSEYFDFVAFGLSIALAIAMSFGLKESSLVNNLVTSLNIGIVLFVIIAGSIKADVENWHLHPENTTNSTVVGTGGFFPFGLDGTIKGAATCFYGFVGFDCIATTGEEVKNPKKAIPISIILSLGIIFLAYFGISTVLTLMVPYYLQDENAPLPYAFDYVGWHWAKWFVAIGGICGLFSSLFGAMFPLPRIIYAMASDGLIFRFLGSVSSRFHTPVIGTILAGILTGSMGALFELSQLVNMMSIGTLMAYTVVAASVLLLRYTENDFNDTNNDDSYLVEDDKSNSRIVAQIFNCGRHSNPTKVSQNIVAFNITLYCIACVAVGVCAIYMKDPIIEGQTWALVLVSFVIFLAAILIISVATQPSSKRDLSFKVPVVPLIPALSILANVYLMLMLDYLTWIRFAVWMAVGLPIYYISLKPIDEQKPTATTINEQKPKETPIERNQNGKVNYYNNVAFVDDTFKYPKKKTAPLPSQINEDKTDVNEINYELQKFDEMLDEVSNNLETIRKSSVGSVSVCMSREKSVVADVHCNNVTTSAIPFPPTLSVEDPTILQHQDHINEHFESLEAQKEALPVEVQNNHKRSGSVDSPAPPDTPVSYKSVIADSEGEIDSSASISPQPTPLQSPLYIDKVEKAFETPSPISPEPTPPKSPLLVDNVEEDDEKVSVNPPPPPLIPPLPQSFLPAEKVEEENENFFVTPPPPPLPISLPVELIQAPSSGIMKPPSSDIMKPPSSDIIKPQSPRQRVTSSAIKGVTLKSWRKRNEKAQTEYVPDDENLKLKSEKAKDFKEQLNNKLSTNFPRYTPFLKYRAPLPPKDIVPTPKEPQKNENVIEESISKERAREKLGLYINTRLTNSFNNNISSNEDRNSLEVTDIPLPNSRPTSLEIAQSDEIKHVVETVDDSYLAHQNRMKNVFRSMRMVDTSKEINSPTRIVKSLDHKIDDHAKHRQAMSDIFDTINLRRKESTKQQTKV